MTWMVMTASNEVASVQLSCFLALNVIYLSSLCIIPRIQAVSCSCFKLSETLHTIASSEILIKMMTNWVCVSLFLMFLLVALWPLKKRFGSDTLATSCVVPFKNSGPQNWEKLPSGPNITNFCSRQNGAPATPLNILTKKASLPIRSIEEEFELDERKPSITFQMRAGLEDVPWQFGYPTDIYYGLEIRGPRLGLIQILDSYDPPLRLFMSYDFNFAFISFCDLQSAANERTSHQLDGKRFPLEINMIFISEPREIGIDNNLPPKNIDTKIIMVSVLGEADGERDNALFEPVIKAAKSYHAGNFDMDDTDDDFFVEIETPFSPTWLLPEESTYYYYKNGTFPVPPCFPLAQVYVFNTPIKISKKQLEVLTTLKSDREPHKKLSCTFGLNRSEISPSKILFNPYNHRFIGNDNRPESDQTGAVTKIKPNVHNNLMNLMYLTFTFYIIKTYE